MTITKDDLRKAISQEYMEWLLPQQEEIINEFFPIIKKHGLLRMVQIGQISNRVLHNILNKVHSQATYGKS